MRNFRENNFIAFGWNKVLLCMLFITSSIAVSAQVMFDNYDSFEAMKKKAAKESKLIFIQRYSGNCQQCDELGEKSLANSLLKEKYNSNFISAKIKQGQSFFSAKDSLLFKSSAGSFYFNSNGDLLLQFNATTDSPYKYLELADQAIKRSDQINELFAFEKEYKGAKTKRPELIRKYIALSNQFDRNIDTVVEDYVAQLPIDSIYNKSVIRLVLEQGLPLSSRIYKLIKSGNSPRTTDSLWNAIDYNKRVEINRKTISSTELVAIRNRDAGLTSELSNFIRNSYGRDFNKGHFYANKTLLNFYKSIKDSKGYLRFSSSFIYSLMGVSNDTLMNWDLKERQLSVSSNAEVRRFSKMSCEYASQLNNIAWTYYEMSNDLEELAKALKWARRAIEINTEVCKPTNKDNSAFLDTYAHLLYKMNQFDEAISWEKKAVEARRNAGFNSEMLDQELEKMQNRSIKPK